MARVAGSIVKYPARASFFCYVLAIAVGSGALLHPACKAEGADAISLLDALFTATSAACVTGLTVRSTAHDFSQLGQLVLLLLIQIGGIGIMTITTLATFRWVRGAGLRQRAVVAETLGAGRETDLVWVLRNVVLLSVALEAAGFLLLAVRNLFDESPAVALWHALFHSVSAFCNAGFALADDSLTRYQTDVTVNLTIIALVVIGGIGFPVLLDLRRAWPGPRRQYLLRLQLHSKIMLIGTAGLLALGTLAVFGLEQRGVLANLSLPERLLVSLFHSVTCRTAGFNSVDIASLTNATLFVSVLLMMIGAGPCSTAGGFKVSTFMVLLLRGLSTARGFTKVSLFRRTIPEAVVARATVTALLFAAFATVALTTVLVMEQSVLPHGESEGVFLEVLFEMISALGTVGLSVGITPQLTDAAKGVIIVLMFAGRIGPISLAVALSSNERDRPIEFPAEEPMIG